MINKLYKYDIIENIKIFSDLKTPNEYSNISKEFNSLFNEFTYSKFVENLKNYNDKLKAININSFYSISSNNKGNKKKNFQEFDILKIKKAIEKMKKKENILKNKIEHPYTERRLNSNPIYTLIKDKMLRKKKEEGKNKKEEIDLKNTSPEIGRYNPLYKSINKHIQQTVFSLKNFEEFNKKQSLKQKTKLNKKLNNKRNKSFGSNIYFTKSINDIKIQSNTLPSFNSENPKKNKNKYNEKIDSKGNNNIFYNTAIIKTRKNLTERNFDKDNHCLRFDTYSSRKPLVNKIFYQTENNLEIPCMNKNIKGSVVFNKVSSNKNAKNYFEKLIYQKKSIPSLGFYRPNYSSVTNKTVNIFFNGKKNKKDNMKITKLKKILGSYYVRGEYQLFNLLNKRKTKI